jgi:hypothetical protein
MLLEFLLISSFLWSGQDVTGNATLNVTCDKVEIHYGGAPTANKKKVAFWMKDLRYNHTYLYSVAMPVGSIGQIVLEPTEFWLEEIRVQKEMVIKIDGKHYIFNLEGSKQAINCD